MTEPRTKAGIAYVATWDAYRDEAKRLGVWTRADEVVWEAVRGNVVAIEAEAAVAGMDFAGEET